MKEIRETLRKSWEESPIVEINGYRYSVNPLTDGVPKLEPSRLSMVTEGFLEIADMDCDCILAPEAMGIAIATGLSLSTGIPLSVIRKRRYGLPGELEVKQVTGYSKSLMYINGLKAGDRVVLVDDVVSTGGTIIGISETLRQAGVNLTEVLVILNKSPDLRELESKVGAPIKCLLDV